MVDGSKKRFVKQRCADLHHDPCQRLPNGGWLAQNWLFSVEEKYFWTDLAASRNA
jgi:hypothetical protein